MSGVIGTLVGDSIDEAEGAVGRSDLVPILRLVIPFFATKSAVINFTERRRSFRATLHSNVKHVILIIGLLRSTCNNNNDGSRFRRTIRYSSSSCGTILFCY
mmetsp:Transcript_14901/g.31882  ORF Transcript_14901/g.31882 Transcript_14901/m.31882 type:complete len:102 (-) Transcript_14901:2-307(-)